jgi:hypothetical protein
VEDEHRLQGKKYNDTTKQMVDYEEEVNDLFEFPTNFKNRYFTRILFDMMLKIKAIIVSKQATEK